MTKQEKAMELHNKGYNCAQAVACSFCEELGLEESVVFAVVLYPVQLWYQDLKTAVRI